MEIQMFRRFFGPAATQVPGPTTPAARADAAGETATVRRIVARLEAMPPDQARLTASAGYILARAAHADLDISDEETAAIEQQLQRSGALDEATAVLVTQMAKLQAKTVGGTEDYVVTREFKALSSAEQRLDVLRACFAISAASGSISAEETAVLNQIAGELDIDAASLNRIRAEYHDRLSAVQRFRQVSGGT
ncbi:MAG TPA: TerB family tellurite resistance protein [Candidatus Limnocylindrales bacterium]|nr:TerB family tellurite resistance protein [Candidatus Limnocylindrales bacterium]